MSEVVNSVTLLRGKQPASERGQLAIIIINVVHEVQNKYKHKRKAKRKAKKN